MKKPNRTWLLPFIRIAVRITAAFAVAAAAPAMQASEFASAPVTGYSRMYGTALNDRLTGITTDTLGNVYIAGNSDSGESSGFLRKYSSEGILLWEKSRSAISIDGVTLDKNGNVYIVGSYASGAGLSLRHRIYLEKYDSEGSILWAKFVLAAPATDPTYMIANGIATDPRGNNWIIILFERAFWPYQTRRVFIRKYNVSGGAIWEKAAGSSSPYTPRPILSTAKNGNSYVAINSASNQRWNANISQFDTEGNPVWSATLFPANSTLESYIHGITADLFGNVYVSGVTKANLEGRNFGSFDAFVRKFDNIGSTLWTRQFGTVANDYANNLTTDAAGNLYVAGSSSGDLARVNSGNFDAVIRKYGSDGVVLKTRQFGSTEFDIANAVRIDTGGNLYSGGHTFGRLGGANNGVQDVYFRKFISF